MSSVQIRSSSKPKVTLDDLQMLSQNVRLRSSRRMSAGELRLVITAQVRELYRPNLLARSGTLSRLFTNSTQGSFHCADV